MMRFPGSSLRPRHLVDPGGWVTVNPGDEGLVSNDERIGQQRVVLSFVYRLRHGGPRVPIVI